MNVRRLFIASCISLLTTSMMFAIRGDIMAAVGVDFKLPGNLQLGLLIGPAFWGFALSILLGGALVDWFGMRRLLMLSGAGYIATVLLIFIAPRPTEEVKSMTAHAGTMMFYAAMLISGLSQGLVEGVINPLIATIYKDEKTHKLNVLHAWWPGGLVIGGVVAFIIAKAMGLTAQGGHEVAATASLGWQIKLGAVLVPTIVYMILIFGQEFPKTERVASGVSTKAMFKEGLRPSFILLFVCMWMTAATELGPDNWVPKILGEMTKMQAVLILSYTAGLMFVLRFFAGPLVHKFSPMGLLTISAILSAAGLFLLSTVSTPFMAFVAATVFGVGKTYFWPTMLGVTSERFPKGGAVLMALMGAAGMFCVGVVIIPWMGAWADSYGPGAAFRYVGIIPIVLTAIFGGWFFYDKARGGYKAEKLEAAPAAK